MILCAHTRCRMLHRHQPDCGTDECRGCLPRPAGDGRNLCDVCTRRLAEDAQQAAELHAELELTLARAIGKGEKTSGTKTPGLEINERAVEARTLIRHTLVSWSLMVAEERGMAQPRDDVAALGEYVRLHAVWLSAHPAAGDCAAELHELAHGWPRRAAYPNPAQVADVGPCPMEGCTGNLTAVFRAGDTLLPSTVDCDWWTSLLPDEREMPPHCWTAYDYRLLRRLFAEREQREAA